METSRNYIYKGRQSNSAPNVVIENKSKKGEKIIHI